MSKLTQAVALTVVALWGLAAMHCKLEALPGLDFLKSCCFVDSAPSSPRGCESDGCGDVEEGSYRAEEQQAAAPQPLLVLALLPPVVQAPLPELPGRCLSESQAPPDLPHSWQFSHRAALPPRPPSLVA